MKGMDDEMIRENFSRQLVIEDERKWEDLNTDCLVNIFGRVGLQSLILHLPFVCKPWYKASLDPLCWKILDFKHLNCTTRAIKFAVKRSCGTATKLVFPTVTDDDIVQYVLERCAALKSLILPDFCGKAGLGCVPKLINKWKDLESLTSPDTYYLEEVLTQIHTHCKKFASLTLTMRAKIRTEIASAIVTFIPNIKQLVLSRCYIDREDLMLILSGCRELKLLDATYCLGFDADDAEILTMASHIKTFMSKGSFVKVKVEDEYDSDSYYTDSYLDYMSDDSGMLAEELDCSEFYYPSDYFY